MRKIEIPAFVYDEKSSAIFSFFCVDVELNSKPLRILFNKTIGVLFGEKQNRNGSQRRVRT